ncbi:hypothetical protein CAG54_09415 [Vibrio sp. V27_P1S3P104]|uniref:hypothetical protein n=1 Tax=Vibrio TaxID=662 RepID=UPI000C16FDD1|nr:MULTISPECIES: hypothetical protein [Vibrio]NAW70518.1 hypothetical protein [Vibrio sp. V28_P6S34P95]NAX04989.1 hypothetical protein [Vibrio sp. V30_P3S12P165]NAX33418.1 hypothetical protein [Vibrio sp. V29_P1S30P107]NAX37713.1 hypothetical protein [Vibrio sp. V27_P1S3P104]NAX39072.1 hypothetical protein [Vibrio sp. V26_P1S5P106]
MWPWISDVIARYDAWCKQWGLTPEQKRSCVPYRQEKYDDSTEKHSDLTEKYNDLTEKHSDDVTSSQAK